MHLFIDDVRHSPPHGIRVKKAPGVVVPFDHGQLIPLPYTGPYRRMRELAPRATVRRLCSRAERLQPPASSWIHRCSRLTADAACSEMSVAMEALTHKRLAHVDVVHQEIETALLPAGFIFKFVFVSTWGDPYAILSLSAGPACLW